MTKSVIITNYSQFKQECAILQACSFYKVVSKKSIHSYSNQMPGNLEPLPPVRAAFARFPKDINPPPREWVERRVDLRQWIAMPRGGHFAAM
jgi:hypothetical protein